MYVYHLLLGSPSPSLFKSYDAFAQYKHGKDPVISGMCTDVACPAAGGSICNGYVVFKIEREKIG
jgi:hypothetical protein